MTVRKAETLYLGDATSVIKATQAAQKANAEYAAKTKASAEQIIATQDKIALAGENATKAAIAAGDSQARASALAGRAALDQAKAVGLSTSRQVAAYRAATTATEAAYAKQTAAAEAASAKQAAAIKKGRDALASMSSSVQSAGKYVLGIGAAAAYSAVKFQKNMELIHTQAGASTAEMDRMSKAVLRLGMSTEQGPQKLAQALYPIESVGLRGSRALAALAAASRGAAVGGSDLTETTHALAGVMVALHEGGDKAAKTMGAIDAIVGVGKMTMQDFVDALSSGIVPTATAVGLSFRSLGAGLATLTDAGIPAEQAATKMRTILLMLAHEHTKEAVSNLDEIGLSADKLATAMRKPGNGLFNVLQLLHDHMEGLSKVKQVDIISSLAGGSRSAGTLISLEQQLGRVGQKYQIIGNLTGQFNSRVAAESETASHKIKVAWSQIQVAGIQLGGMLLPIVAKVAHGVSTVVKAFTSLPASTKNAIVTGGLILAGVGVALKVIDVFVSGAKKIKAVGEALGAVGQKIGLIKTATDETAASGGLSRVMPWVAGLGVAFLGVKKLSDAINGDGGLNAALTKMSTQFTSSLRSGDTNRMATIASDAQQMASKLDQAGIKGGDAFRKMAARATTAQNQIHGAFGLLQGDIKKTVEPVLADMAAQAGKKMSDIKLSVAIGAAEIPTLLGKGSQAARQALAKNFQIAIQDVQKSMATGVVSTSAGIAEINKLLVAALRALGSNVKLSDVKAIGIAGAQALIGYQQTGATGAGRAGTFAGGGIVQFGRSGDKGRDTIPVNFGGTPIKVGSGEVGAVFNHTQQKVANALLLPVGGLHGLFSNFTTPHYMASGGVVIGGKVSTFGPPGEAAGATASGNPGGDAAPGISLHIPGTHYSDARNRALMGRMFRVVIGGHTATLPDIDLGPADYLNRAIDVTGAGARLMGIDPLNFPTDAFGTATLIGGGAGLTGGVTGAAAAAVQRILAPRLKGHGLVNAVAQAAVNKVAAAANAFASRHQPAVGSSGAGSFGPFAGNGASIPGDAVNWHGVTMARWIADELQWAWGHGWRGQPTSGYRPGRDPHTASGTSEHQLLKYPGGAVDFGGFTDPAAYQTKLALVELAQRLNYPGPRLMMPIGFHDDGHLSGTGHARGGLIPFVGSFKNGGHIHQDGLAHVHRGETVIPASEQVPTSIVSLLGGIMSRGQMVANGLAQALLFPLDAVLTILSNFKVTAKNHASEIAKLDKQLTALKSKPAASHEITSLKGELDTLHHESLSLLTAAAGKKGAAQRAANAEARKKIALERLDIEKRIHELESDNKLSKQKRADEEKALAAKVKGLKEEDAATLKLAQTNLARVTQQVTQLKGYRDALANIRSQVKDLASQAAQVWQTRVTGAINAGHDAALALIQSGPAAAQLKAMQAQDAATQNQQQLDSLNKGITDAQFLVAHSAGQTHIDALAQLKAAQDALTAYQRQQEEQRLQDQVDSATKAADQQQQTALAGVDKQTADFQAGLDKQLAALADNLAKRKINYATWAADVNAVLAPYGLSTQSDAATESTVDAGPGPAASGKPSLLAPKHAVKLKAAHHATTHHVVARHHRASGGPVEPGYVYRVGENGPEDVMFGQRGTVLTADQTRGRHGRSGPAVHIEHFHSHGAREARAFADRIAFRAQIGVA